MKQIPVALLTLVAGIVVTLVSFWVGQNHGLMPEQASGQAPLVDQFFDVMMTIGTALFLVVEGAIILFAIMFRQRKGDESDGEPIEGNVPLEIFWTAIPAIIVIGLGIYSVEVYAEMGGFDPTGEGTMMMAHHHHVSPDHAKGSAIASPMIANGEEIQESETLMAQAQYGFGASPENEKNVPDVAVDVLGLQYAWIFTYPDTGIVSGELHIPEGGDVQLNIKAQDVIHSLWIPQFRLKQDAIPGQNTTLRFQPTQVGEYPIVCAELCGSYHGSMRSKVIIHSPEDYDNWVTENQIAQANGELPAIATSTGELTPQEFLAPYANSIGVDPETLAKIQSAS